MVNELESIFESELIFEIEVKDIDAYNASEIIEKDFRNGKDKYFGGINFQIISYNVCFVTNSGTIGVKCKNKRDKTKLKNIFPNYIINLPKRYTEEYMGNIL